MVDALYDVPAPAKINLFLHVVGRRPDGYHLLQTVFRFIDLADTLDYELRQDGRIVCDSSVPGLEPKDDLVVRAAEALQGATGCRLGANIRYAKRIPAGGGLGGGSSDAATTLIALNRLWGTGLTRGELMRLALPLGADVPVFVFGQPAFAEGIGEILTPVQLPERAYVVVQPQQHVPTEGIFSAPDLTRDSPSVKMSVFADWQTDQAQRGSDLQPSYFGRNDLEPVVLAKYPQVRRTASWLGENGVIARMTGSGACFFAEFVSMDQALVCQRQIASKIDRDDNLGSVPVAGVWVCQGLADHPLRYWVHD